ncbi:MAG: hypothetical protein ACD_37C00633G0004 [uncultured bacterium]|nr:MAG: hypothetical protein ACD_37C00633G0004 [uncultured bacterium]OGH31547.1 MAG: hypothetical protein A3E70_00165 [Candidatus Levybacteria bacterium RIFCSPHIGHO2_12_FULL_40_44]OGH41243.1 MAG: hypothetical protein A2965_00435 [Candidatus Levybacteria bacterium RIFCSPLOWO2_01_FULL_40_96]OGH70241.1 MAG: hypothetical protein A2396_00265 [Candidatus Levybacteria bacterium RIFOXYB1_FULL_40_17]
MTRGKKNSKFKARVINRDILFKSEREKISRVRRAIIPHQIYSKDKEKIVALANASDSILFQATTVFPFTFFPDSIIIDKTKVTIIERLFFFHQNTTSYAIEDILNVEVGSGLLFSILTCLTRYDNKKAFSLRYLKNGDAIFAKKLLQGLIIAKREGVHIEELSKEEIMTHGEVIGKGEREE